MLTDQEVFDKIVAHLRKQNAKSVDNRSAVLVCKYRGSNNMMCAVGCLIPDSRYKPSLEYLATDQGELREILLDYTSNFPLLITLQEIHDKTSVENWEKGFQQCAETFKLEYTPCS